MATTEKATPMEVDPKKNEKVADKDKAEEKSDLVRFCFVIQ